MEKVIRDGKVAVLFSPGYGAGWFSWNDDLPQLLFHPKIVEMVEADNKCLLTEKWLKQNGIVDKEEYVYCGGAEGLRIEWLPEGTRFRIDEYDGHETIETFDSLTLIA